MCKFGFACAWVCMLVGQVDSDLTIQTIRKRKREVLEEEDEISEDELLKQKQNFDAYPTDFSLPQDTTGATAIF